jgi:hypothetical protein
VIYGPAARAHSAPPLTEIRFVPFDGIDDTAYQAFARVIGA